MTVAIGRIRKDEGVLGGKARIRDLRIPVWLLVARSRAGVSEPDLLRDYPDLELADLESAWAYASAHAQEIEAALAEDRDADEE